MNRIVLLAAFAAGLSLCGCGKSQPKLYPVSGQILFNDQPLENAWIVFITDKKRKPMETPNPTAVTGPDGVFHLMTFADGDGAPAGAYKVIVYCPTSVAEGNGAPPSKKDVFNGRYGTADETPLTAEVKKQNNELPPFKLY